MVVTSIEGVSDQMNAITSQNLEHAPVCKRVRPAFTQVQEQLDHVLFKMTPTDITTEEVDKECFVCNLG
nr:caffeoylshikimate esterase [Tanacetum cinerariifolium]